MPTSHSARPEAGLHALRDRLYDLLRALPVLNKPELEASVLPVLRKVEIARLLDAQYVVAVTGLQGVGKTTLMRALYGLPEGVLPEGVGRGEKIPIWILERTPEDDGPDMAVVEVTDRESGKSADLRERPIEEAADFAHIAQNPESRHFLLKLRVEPTFFQGDKSFLLLPGIEGDGESADTMWVELARHALSCADAAVFVANESGWARHTTQRELERLETMLSGSHPVVVLTGQDQSSDDHAELIETVARDMNVPDDERDRLLPTHPEPGAPGRSDWRQDLRHALQTYSATSRSARTRQLEHLKKVLTEEVLQLLQTVGTESKRAWATLDANEFSQVRHVTNEMEAEIQTLRADYSVALRKQLDTHQGKAVDALGGGIIEKGFWDKVKGLFGGDSLKDRTALRDAVARAWAAGDAPALLHGRALNDTVAPRLARYNALPTGASVSRQDLLGTFAAPAPVAATDEDDLFGDDTRPADTRAINPQVLSDAHILMIHGADKAEFSDSLLNSVRVLPALAVEAVRIGTIAPGLFDLEGKAFAPADQIKHVGDEFGALRESHSGILKGVAGMLGLDFVADGEFDIVKDLVGKAGVPAAAGGPVTFAIVGAIAVAYTAMSVSAAVNRAEIDQHTRGSNAIAEIADQTHAAHLAEFDRMMNLLVEHVKNRLVGYYHLGTEYARIARLDKAFADAREERLRIQHTVSDALLLA